MDNISLVSLPSDSTSSYILPDADGKVDDGSPVQTAALGASPTVDSPQRQHPPAGNKPAAERQTLMLAFIEGDAAQYAVVPFPETYQAAVAAAIAVLGSYMNDPTPENIVLKCSAKSRKGVWIWADIEPMNWKLVLGHYADEVGVFEKIPFTCGKVYVTFGRFDGTTTQWHAIQRDGLYNIVDRPRNYREAVNIMKSWGRCRVGCGSLSSTALNPKYTFYLFGNDSLHSWFPFPPTAYTDDVVWRAVVPDIGKSLGVQISHD
jgi:hypothetical protein